MNTNYTHVYRPRDVNKPKLISRNYQRVSLGLINVSRGRVVAMSTTTSPGGHIVLGSLLDALMSERAALNRSVLVGY